MGFVGGLVARAFFYPSILLNAASNTIFGESWYNRINDHIVLGALPMPFMTADLQKENIKGVISLNESYELQYLYNSEKAWRKAGMRTLRLSTPDLFAAPTIDNIKTAIQFIEEVRPKGSIYVHCKAGKTRSTTVVLCYLMHHNNLHPDEAMELVKQKRPQVWLRTPQIDCIRQYYEQEIKPKTTPSNDQRTESSL